MHENGSVTEIPRDGFSVDNRGYIHGGFDTPIFLEVKREHNSRITIARSEQKRKKYIKSSTYGLKPEDPRYIQAYARFGDPGFNRPQSHPMGELGEK